MKAHVSLCKCVDSPEPLLPAYTKYRCRRELRQLATLRQHGHLMLAFANICLVQKSHLPVKSSFEHFINQQLFFHRNAIISHTFATVKEQI